MRSLHWISATTYGVPGKNREPVSFLVTIRRIRFSTERHELSSEVVDREGLKG